jgi:hypothetical protein
LSLGRTVPRGRRPEARGQSPEETGAFAVMLAAAPSRWSGGERDVDDRAGVGARSRGWRERSRHACQVEGHGRDGAGVAGRIRRRSGHVRAAVSCTQTGFAPCWWMGPNALRDGQRAARLTGQTLRVDSISDGCLAGWQRNPPVSWVGWRDALSTSLSGFNEPPERPADRPHGALHDRT